MSLRFRAARVSAIQCFASPCHHMLVQLSRIPEDGFDLFVPLALQRCSEGTFGYTLRRRNRSWNVCSSVDKPLGKVVHTVGKGYMIHEPWV